MPTSTRFLESLNPDRWHEQYADYLRDYARRKLNDEDLVKDIVQDTFLTAFEQTPKFRHSSSEKTWLVGILKLKSCWPTEKKRTKGFFLYGGLIVNIDDQNRCQLGELGDNSFAVDIEDHLCQKELFSIVLRALLNFRFTWRAVLLQNILRNAVGKKFAVTYYLTQTQYWMICHRLRVGLRMSLVKGVLKGRRILRPYLRYNERQWLIDAMKITVSER